MSYVIEIEIDTEKELSEEEKRRLVSVIENGTVIDSLRAKASVTSIEGAAVIDREVDHRLRDVKALESYYGKEANSEEAEPFHVSIEKGEHLRVNFSREGEKHDRTLLIEQHGNNLHVIAASQEGIDPDAIIEIREMETSVSSATGRSLPRTFSGTKQAE